MASDPRRVGNGIERQSARLARLSQPLPEGAPVANVPSPAKGGVPGLREVERA